MSVWHEYFAGHLGGFPWAMRALLAREIWGMTVPEQLPQWFDPSFTPDARYRIRLPDETEEFTTEHRAMMSARFDQLIDDLKRGRLSSDSGERGPAPVGTIFANFDEAVRRHGKPQNS